MKFTCHYINVDIYICVKNRKKKQICAQVPSAYLEYYSVVLHPVVEADTERVVTREIGALTHQEEAVLAGHQDLLRHLSGYLAMKPGHLHRLGRHFAVLGTVAADLFALHTLLHEMNFEKKLALSTYLRKEVIRVAKGAQRANCHIGHSYRYTDGRTVVYRGRFVSTRNSSLYKRIVSSYIPIYKLVIR